MAWDEAEVAFLRSRRLGIYGAKTAVKERTVQEYQWDLHFFFDFMKARQFKNYNQMTDKDVLAYIEHVQNQEAWSKATKRKYMISLKAFFRWVDLDPDCAAAQMKSYFKLMPRIGKEIRRTFIPTPEQMKVFAEGFDRNNVWGLRDYTALAFMLDTGARAGEVRNLEEDDFKWDVSLVQLDSKTGERLVPFSVDTVGTLISNWIRVREHYAHPDSKKVFISRFGGGCVPDMFRQSFADNMKRTKLDKVLGRDSITPHTVRHYFCTHYLVNGGTLHNLQRITGHKSVETLMIYVHMARQISTVKEEAARVSPLKSLLAAESKKRVTVRL